MQLEKQIMSSKKQRERENNVGLVIGEQNETSRKSRNRKAMTEKGRKQMGEAIGKNN